MYDKEVFILTRMNDELYHYGRKGMKKGMNIFNPDYKPIGEKAETGTPLQRQPVKNTKRKRLASMEAERAAFKTFKLTPEKYNNAIAISKQEMRRNLNVKGAIRKAKTTDAQKKNSAIANDKISNDFVKKQKLDAVINKNSKVTRSATGTQLVRKHTNPLVSNSQWSKSWDAYATKAGEVADKEYKKSKLASNKKRAKAMADEDARKRANPLDPKNAQRKAEAKEKQIEKDRKKKKQRTQTKRQGWQH